MAEPIPFLGANKELKPDPNQDSYSLPVYAQGNDWVSCWLFNQEEIKQINETGRVWLRLRGRTHPFLTLQVDDPFSD